MAKVVIVENDLDIGPLVSKLLELEGHQPVMASEPSRACDVIFRERPDVVYLDVRLTQQIDGFSILRQIRAQMDVPVLMCSGLNVEQKCLDAGADAFLLKPFDFQDLLDGIERALETKGGKAR